MSAGTVETGSRPGRGGQSQDFELNLASIIDCLTVLIAFILASASFLSIGILDAGVAAAGSQASPGTPPPVNVAVELGADHELTVKVTGKQNETRHIPGKPGMEGARDFDSLTRELATIKGRWPMISAVTLSASDHVAYEDVVKAMQVTRQQLPVVLLGGF